MNHHRPFIPRHVPKPPTAEELLQRALASGDAGEVEIDWREVEEEEEELNAECEWLADLIADAIPEAAQLEVRMVDEGIGPYEYWGARGVDVQWCAEIDEESHTVVSIPGAPADLELPEVQTIETGGGCDGEHSGRCRACCEPWHVDVLWKPDYRELHDGTLWVVYFATEAS